MRESLLALSLVVAATSVACSAGGEAASDAGHGLDRSDAASLDGPSTRDVETTSDAAGADARTTSPDGSTARDGSTPVDAGPGYVFSYFISPTGDDSNDGSLMHPWSITALTTKGALYAGKAIGLIGDQGPIQSGAASGVKTSLYSLIEVGTGQEGPAVQVQGGASSSTVLASCTSTGVYSPRLATIDADDPTTKAHPDHQRDLLGQSDYWNSVPSGEPGNTVTQYGRLTVDGLVIRNFTFSGVTFYRPPGEGGITNAVVKNSELYGGGEVISNNNPAAIRCMGCTNLVVDNTKIHDCQTVASEPSQGPGSFYPWHHSGIFTYQSTGSEYTRDTIYNIGVPVQTKDDYQQANVSYSYLEIGNFGAPMASLASNEAYALAGFVTGVGLTEAVHHNIIIGPLFGFGMDSSHNQGTLLVYNNTFFLNQPQQCAIYQISDTSPVGTAEFYDNIVFSSGGYADGDNAPGAVWINSAVGISGSTFDYNYYGTGATFATSWNSGQANQPLSWWQGLGYDTHSKEGANPFAATPAPQDAASFSLAKGSVAQSSCKGGATCGALDGTGSIGCDF